MKTYSMNQNQPGQVGGSNVVFQLRNLMQGAQSVLIALSASADEDATAAALALYLVLSKMRKQVTVVSPSKVKVERAHLFGIDKIANQISGGNTLVVSLPYNEGAIEKVSYNIENNRFNLVIEPRGKALSFNPDQIEYNYGKGDYDLVFVIGAAQLNDLGILASKHANAFSNKPIVNIDNSQHNTGFGRVNLVNNVPISQMVTVLIKALRIPLDQDPASNLYTGITSAARGVTLESASPDALEAIAFLLRSNAQLLQQSGQSDQSQPAQQSRPAKQGRQPRQKQKRKDRRFQQPQQPLENTQASPQTESFTVPAQSSGVLQQQATQQNQPSAQEDIKNDDETPEDWLKPKIFTTQKSSTRVN